MEAIGRQPSSQKHLQSQLRASAHHVDHEVCRGTVCRGFTKRMVTRGKEVEPGPGEPGWVAGPGLTPCLSSRGGAAGPEAKGAPGWMKAAPRNQGPSLGAGVSVLNTGPGLGPRMLQ